MPFPNHNKKRTQHIPSVVLIMWVTLGVIVIIINMSNHYHNTSTISPVGNIPEDTTQQTKLELKTTYYNTYADIPATFSSMTNYSFESIIVKKGRTLVLDCNINNLPQEIPLIWERTDTANGIIAISSKIINHKYKQKAKLINKDRILTIVNSDTTDSGKYLCSAAIPNESPMVEFDVKVTDISID